MAAVQENGAKPGKELAPPSTDKSLAAEASSAHSRINIPLNLNNWKDLPDEVRDELLWFHQYLLDNDLSMTAAAEAIGYDNSVVFRVLKGIYEGSYENVVKAIQKYRWQQNKSAQHTEFVETQVSKLVFAGLNYALTNNSITIIIGESRMGKSVSAKEWAARNNHGRSVFVTAPVVGGVGGLVRQIASRCGVNKNRSVNDIIESLYRAFNGKRILIVDEAHRLMPTKLTVVNPVNVELLRDLHDQTGCALALLATRRFTHQMKKGVYQYEQLVGRVGMPIMLPQKIKRDDVLPIVRQFIKTPSDALLTRMHEIANSPGRLGIMVETLKAARRIAASQKARLVEEHIAKAIAFRQKMSGEDQ
jgi:DNA transposition AAA+ family ATPase